MSYAANLVWQFLFFSLERPAVFGLIALMVAGALAYVFFEQDTLSRKRLLPLIFTLPSIWILMGLWAAVFWKGAAQSQTPGWIVYPLSFSPLVLLIVGAFFVARLSGLRLFTAAYMLLNVCLAAPIWFFGLIGVTGDGP